MKRLLLAMTSAALTLSMAVSTTQAQDGVPQFVPVEMWACSFNDGKDQEDMDDVYDLFIGEDNESPYAAWQINPYFAGNLNQQFDFLYLGAWANGAAMGAGVAGDLASDDVSEAWDDAVNCGALMFASLTIEETPEPGEAGDDFILTIQDCNVGHAVSNGQASSAIRAYNDYRVANGLTVATFIWYPIAGGGDADFDFKLVRGYDDAQAWGNANQWIVDNMAYVRRGQLLDGIVSCDESRVYTGRTLMNNLN
jgi:hypothetical protein